MDEPIPSRRQFLAAVGNLASAAWITINWPQIALAADQADHSAHGAAAAGPTKLSTLTPAEAAEIDAITNLIVPGGTTPGARDIRVVYFIDNALGSFFGTQLAAFRTGLTAFQSGYAGKNGGALFSAAPEAAQTAYLHEVDKTPFFEAVRRLTILGITSMPKYGGNFEGKGSKLIGVIDSHYWEPPFGYYDRDYAGFQPYPGTKIQMA